MEGRPKTEIQTYFKKTVTMELTEEMVSDAIVAYLLRHYAEFRGTELKIIIDCGGYEGCNFNCTAVGTKEKKK